ncbi:MAG TPA: D-arabinose 5-phosphate isomerase [Rheinheimera sp.]|nr:D-arabinose 5-phosphate isomerase [Rheinheimera sp.]
MVDYRASARRVLDIESKAVAELQQYLNEQFQQACELMFSCQGRIVVIGMGKSGHVGNKIAATLASTGTPAFFVHPGEASHGDLGMITSQDVVLALSNSGETDEVLKLIPVLKRLGISLIAMTGNAQSNLARLADIHVQVSVAQEACPLGLAPTASTTAALAMGDALAVALLEARGFSADDFALSHPGGSLGRRLLLRISDIMHKDEQIPLVTEDASLPQALLEISKKGLGMTGIVSATGSLAGIFTDGDLRRVLDQRVDIHQTTIASVMTKNCITVQPHLLAAEALQIMEKRKINALMVVDAAHRPVGALNMHDLLKAGVI